MTDTPPNIVKTTTRAIGDSATFASANAAKRAAAQAAANNQPFVNLAGGDVSPALLPLAVALEIHGYRTRLLMDVIREQITQLEAERRDITKRSAKSIEQNILELQLNNFGTAINMIRNYLNTSGIEAPVFETLPLVPEHNYAPVSGFAPYLDAFRSYWANQGLEIPTDQMIPAFGGKGALHNIFYAILNEDDTVLRVGQQVATWNNYETLATIHGAELEHFTSENFDEMGGPSLRDHLLNNPDIRAVVINSPSNPTGERIPDDAREAFFQMMLGVRQERHSSFALSQPSRPVRDITVIVDNPYELYAHDDKPFTAGPFEQQAYEEGLIAYAGTASKAFAITGERPGIVACADPDILELVKRHQANTVSGVPYNTQLVAAIAMHPRYEHEYARMRDAITERAVNFVNAVREMGLDMPDPREQGGIYVYINGNQLGGFAVPEQVTLRSGNQTIQNSNDFMDFLLHYGVATVSGEAFGDSGIGVRANIAQPDNDKDIAQAIDMLEGAMSELAAANRHRIRDERGDSGKALRQ